MPTVETTLANYINPDFKKDGPRIQYFPSDGVQNPELAAKVSKSDSDATIPSTKVTINDARQLQKNSKMSNAEFFKEHGFVLLNSKTKVTKWNADYLINFKWMGV